MTTLTDFRPYYEVVGRVEQARSRLRSVGVLEGLFALVTIVCAAVLVMTLAQGYLRFGAAGRLTLLVLGAGTAVVAFWRCFLIPIRYDPNDKEVARFLEMRIPELGNSLINTLLLAERADDWSSVLVERAIGEAAAGARGIDLMAAVSERRARRWGLAACAAMLLLGVWVAAAFDRFSSAAGQILMPFSYVASKGEVRFLSITPGTVAWVKGEPMAVEAVIADPAGKPYEGFVEIEGGPEAAAGRKNLARTVERLDHFSYRLPQVLQPFTYRLNVGGTESPVFKVTLREPPLVERIDVVYNYPDYTGLEPQKVENNGGEIRCLIGTTVDLTVRVSSAVEAGDLLFGGGQTVKCVPAEAGRAMTARFTVLANDTYQIHLGGQAPDGAAVMYRILAQEDQKPVVQFTVPARDVGAGLGETVKMSLKASDRYGLADVTLLAQADGAPQPRVVQTWKKFADAKEYSMIVV